MLTKTVDSYAQRTNAIRKPEPHPSASCLRYMAVSEILGCQNIGGIAPELEMLGPLQRQL